MASRVDRRPSPEELLRKIQADERRERRGRLKVFLGYASHVGKSFRMFDEGRRRKERGEDVVAGAVQSRSTPDIQGLMKRIEVIPTIQERHAGRVYEVIDLAALFRRHPQVCLIDELAYDNPPGSRNPRRWQDVEELLERGIGVLTAINVQHIQEQQDEVERITGKRAANSVPEAFLHAADEIEVVDAPPEALLGRTRGGGMPDPRRLAELRELALLLAADVVDRHLQETYLDCHGIAARWGAQERILVCLTPRSSAGEMLRSGQRNARRFHGALLAAYVEQSGLRPQDRERLESNLALARQMGAEVHFLKGADFVKTILDFAREQRISQLFIGHTGRAPRRWFSRSPVDRLIDAAEDFDVRLFPNLGPFMSGSRKGRLKVYLGYAAGVGKTYRMLEEAQELRRKGVDVVIGYFEPHGRRETIVKTEGFETVPRRVIAYAGSQFEEMDTDAILRRAPAVAIVDEFAHTNVPGSERLKRWQDVHALLEAGIDVITTMNVQHLESLNDQVWHVTGVRVRETIPDWVVDEADEVVFVDLTPGALRNRLDRGVVYPQEKARTAMEKFFTESNLTALREMAMRHAAHEVEEKLQPPRLPAGQAGSEIPPPGAARPSGHERILICLTARPSSAILIRRGKRVADYLQADCLAIHVAEESGRASPGAAGPVERHMSFARNLRIETHLVEAPDIPRAIAGFARAQGITQIFMGRSLPRPWWKRFRETVVQQVVRQARDMQITIVAERRR